MVEVSVVMGVFNGADALPLTLNSVLDQQGCEFELVVVDDGSTDATPRVLEEWAARDARLRVIRQPANLGLTRALALGCEQAKGALIARQDCGDISLPGRLQRQASLLRANPDTVMAACAVRFIGPAGEPLYVVERPGVELHKGLSGFDLQNIKGPPHHGATMFRRAAYQRAGGYRPAFVVAQDMDLWLRLRELGQCLGDAHIDYEAKLEAGSISASRRSEQFQFAALALDCARARSRGKDDAAILGAPRTGVPAAVRNRRLERARFFYFIGSCLRKNDRATARRYYWKSFAEHPLLFKALVRLLLG
jgi:glycosyltransferase involved in cell wall biosynthesis